MEYDAGARRLFCLAENDLPSFLVGAFYVVER
jgi:hypothetical protein